MPPSYFVSAAYDGRQQKAIVKLYEPESGELYFWYDNTGHKPYCLTSMPKEKVLQFNRIVTHPGYDSCITEQRFDPLSNQNIQVTKIVAKDPLAIGGRPNGTIRDIIPEDYPQVCGCQIHDSDTKIWESKIKYYQSYIYDLKLLPGMMYQVKEGNLQEATVHEAEQTLEKIREIFNDATPEEREFAEMWAKLLEYPAPKFEGQPSILKFIRHCQIACLTLEKGLAQLLLVQFTVLRETKKFLSSKGKTEENGKIQVNGIDVEFCETEEDVLREVFKVLNDFPFILTFNGDDFDLRYLVHRALNLGFSRREIPIEVGKRVCLIKYGIHIDLYKFFFNRSIQIYAYSNRYKDVGLGDVGAALLGMEKIHLDKAFGDLSYSELSQYCLRDSEITYKLTSFDDDSAMKLLLVLTRISSMPMEDVSRQGVSRWIRNFMHREHRKRGLLIQMLKTF
jgi:DNA polymerase I